MGKSKKRKRDNPNQANGAVPTKKPAAPNGQHATLPKGATLPPSLSLPLPPSLLALPKAAIINNIKHNHSGLHPINHKNKDKLTHQQAPPSYDSIVSQDDMLTTMATLSELEDHPDIFKGKSCKAIRALVHHLYKVMTSSGGEGKSLTGRISDALVGGRWEDALDDLKEMRARGRAPPLGALQRWVKDCDAASARDGAFGDPIVLRVLDSVLRTADPTLVGKADSKSVVHPVRRHPHWEPLPKVKDNDAPFYESSLNGTLYTPEEQERFKKCFRVVEHVKGPQRRTPNRHDLILYLSSPNTVMFDPEKPPVTRLDVPNVPNAFVLTHVLSQKECRQVVAAAESIGFTGDAPLASESVSVLAHNFFWLADTHFLDTLVERCRPFMPPTISGGNFAGINARWRVYRYVPGAIYRPHIDGSWPGSGMCPTTDKYLFDAYGDRMSRLTFLLYLNDDAEGGSTTFFLPSHEVGYMNSFGVTPRKGCVLVFPHGEVAGSLLHEGSPVLSGAKYVIRTDVLYMKSDLPDPSLEVAI